MALTVEDGSVVAGADSYMEVADITAELALIGDYPLWTAADPAAQEQAARRAARHLDRTYRTLLLGTRASATQEMEFPRKGMITRDGHTIAANAIPAEVPRSQALLAARAIEEDLEPDVDSTRANVSETIKVGPITVSETKEEGVSVGDSHTRYKEVDLEMGRLLRSPKPSGLVTMTLERA